MPSLRYRALAGLLRLFRVNRIMDKEGPAFDKFIAGRAKLQDRPIKVPYRKLTQGLELEEKSLDGMDYYLLRPRGQAQDRALIYLFGGGFVGMPDSRDFTLAGEIAQEAQAAVYFPIYPLAPSHTIGDSTRAVLALYKEVLKDYGPGQVKFFGMSSGACLALAACTYIKEEGLDLPYPSRLILQSPALQTPPSEDQMKKMEALRDKDLIIPPSFFINIVPVISNDQDAYLLNPLLYDLSGIPPIDLFYGTHELMYAYADDMEAACEKYGVDLTLHLGQGMAHCWGALDLYPEAREVREVYFRLLAGD